MTAYTRDAVLRALSLPERMLPLAASLIGNDFVDAAALSSLHAALLPGRHANGGPLIEASVRGVGLANRIAVFTWKGVLGTTSPEHTRCTLPYRHCDPAQWPSVAQWPSEAWCP